MTCDLKLGDIVEIPQLIFEEGGKNQKGGSYDNDPNMTLACIENIFKRAALPEFKLNIELEIIDILHTCLNRLMPLTAFHVSVRSKYTLDGLYSKLREESSYTFSELVKHVKKFYSLQLIFFSYLDGAKIFHLLGYASYDTLEKDFISWFGISIKAAKQLRNIACKADIVKYKSPLYTVLIDHEIKKLIVG